MGVMSAPVAADEGSGCAAQRMWRNACGTLVVPDADAAWDQVVDASPPDSLWHSLRNCVAYQAGVWQNLLNKGTDDVIQPAAFKLAIVLRHTPSELTVKLLADLLHLHPQAQDLTSYILALLTDDEALSSGENSTSESSSESSPTSSGESSSSVEETDEADGAEATDEVEAEADAIEETNEAEAAEPVVKSSAPPEPFVEDSGPAVAAADSSEIPLPETPPFPSQPSTPAGPAPLRDLRLFGDCEMAVMAASREEYDAHAKLVRAEYSKLTHDNYVELRIKVLEQFNQVPKLFYSPEFECLESAARENIEREICTLREHLLTGSTD